MLCYICKYSCFAFRIVKLVCLNDFVPFANNFHSYNDLCITYKVFLYLKMINTKAVQNYQPLFCLLFTFIIFIMMQSFKFIKFIIAINFIISVNLVVLKHYTFSSKFKNNSSDLLCVSICIYKFNFKTNFVFFSRFIFTKI